MVCKQAHGGGSTWCEFAACRAAAPFVISFLYRTQCAPLWLLKASLGNQNTDIDGCSGQSKPGADVRRPQCGSVLAGGQHCRLILRGIQRTTTTVTICRRTTAHSSCAVDLRAAARPVPKWKPRLSGHHLHRLAAFNISRCIEL